MSKLFTLLRSLSASEMKKFQEMVNSSYFNKREDVRQLLKSYTKNMKEEVLYQQLYPSKNLEKKDWHLLCSRLYKLGEKFLILEELNAQPVPQKILLANAFRNRKQPIAFVSTIKNGQKILDKSPIRDTLFWQQKFTLENEYFDFIASHDRKKKTNIQEINDALDVHFISQKLKLACLTHARQIITSEQYDIHLLKEIIQFVENHSAIRKLPSVEVYYLCFKAVTDVKQEHWFTDLRQSIAQHQHHFSATERRDIFLFATNYCIRRLNEGKVIFIKEAFELYRLNLSAGFLLEDGVMQESTFSNIVTLAVKLKKYAWAEEFILQNSEFLKTVFQQPLFHFSMGRLHFEKNEFDASLQHLARVETKAGFLLLGTKILQLKIYYQQNQHDLMEYILDSLRGYLQRRKDLGYRKQNYEQVLYFFKKLSEVSFQSKADKAALVEEIENTVGFSEKDWMLKILKF